MKLTKSRLKQLIKEELRTIINENIGDRSIEEDLEEVISDFQDTFDGLYPNEPIGAYDLKRLNAIFQSLKTVLGNQYAGHYEDEETEDSQ